jgi:AAA domain
MVDAASQTATKNTFYAHPAVEMVALPRVPPGIVAEAAARLQQGATFLALTGPDVAMNSAAAAALEIEMTTRSMSVLTVRAGNSNGLGLTTIAAQLLGKAEAGFDTDDIERLFDVLTDHTGSGRLVVLLIDGAEGLRPDAVNYLRLLSTLASTAAPKIVFVGQPEFWQAAAALKDLIGARWTLPSAAEPGEDEASPIQSAAAELGAPPTIGADRPAHSSSRLAAFNPTRSAEFRHRDAGLSDMDLPHPMPALLAAGPATRAKPRRRLRLLYAGLAVGICGLLFATAKAVNRAEVGAHLQTLLASYLPSPVVARLGIAPAMTPNQTVAMPRRPTPATGLPVAAMAKQPAPDVANRPSPASVAAREAAQTVAHAVRHAAAELTGTSAEAKTPAVTIDTATNPPPPVVPSSRPIVPAPATQITSNAQQLRPAEPTIAEMPLPIVAQPESSGVKALLARGDMLLAMGDITAARLLYQRAASLGSGRGATAVGKTYDPDFLAAIRVTGPRPDRSIARTWYQNGMTLGDAEAAPLLQRLGAGDPTN